MILLDDDMVLLGVLFGFLLAVSLPLILLIVGFKKMETRPALGKTLILLAVVYTIIGIGLCSRIIR